MDEHRILHPPFDELITKRDKIVADILSSHWQNVDNDIGWILERHRPKNFTLKLDGLFMGTSSLAPKWSINSSSVLECH